MSRFRITTEHEIRCPNETIVGVRVRTVRVRVRTVRVRTLLQVRVYSMVGR